MAPVAGLPIRVCEDLGLVIQGVGEGALGISTRMSKIMRVSCKISGGRKVGSEMMTLSLAIKDENETEISRTEPVSIFDPIEFVFSCPTLPLSLSYFRCFVFQM